ncbi:MAG: hypothetical protein QW177_09525 [Candidatus Nitrosotenuis sp.]
MSAVFVLLNAATLPAWGQDQSPAAKYEIGIYLLNVGKVDLQTGAYDLCGQDPMRPTLSNQSPILNS